MATVELRDIVTEAASSRLVGFVTIGNGIPRDVLDADPDIVGPYFPWRRLIDAHHQDQGEGGRRSMPSSTASGHAPLPTRSP